MATIKEVARRAQVSVGTVSNVLSGLPTVSTELRERVEQAMAEMQYQPSHIARSLKLKHTQTLALVISDIMNPFFSMVVRGAEDAAAERGYMLSIFNTDDDIAREQKICHILSARRIDGLLLVPTLERGDDAHVRRLMNLGTPVVYLDRAPTEANIDCVIVDGKKGVAKGVKHLIEQGAKRIVYVGGHPGQFNAIERYSGYQAAMKAAGLPQDPELVWEGDFRQESGYELAMERLKKVKPDAVFTGNLPVGLGVMKAMGELGMEAPRDLLMATFDYLEILDSFRPRLTCVAQPAYQLGYRGVARLLEKIANRECPPQVIRLDAEMKPGETSIPLRK